MSVTIRGLYFEHAVADFQHGHVEGAAAQVEHGDFFVLLLIQTVRQRGGGRLVDDTKHFKTRDLAGVFCRLALRVIEVSRNRNDGLRDFFAEIGLGVGFQFTEHEGGDLLRRELFGLVAHLNFDVCVAVLCLDDFERETRSLLLNFGVFATDKTLGGENRIAGIRDGLPFCGLTDQTLAVLRKRHHGRCRPSTFGIGDNYGLAALHDGHTRVRST